MYSDLPEISFIRKISPIWGEELRNITTQKELNCRNRQRKNIKNKESLFKTNNNERKIEKSKIHNFTNDKYNYFTNKYCDNSSENTTTVSNDDTKSKMSNQTTKYKRSNNFNKIKNTSKTLDKFNIEEITNNKDKSKFFYYRSRSRSVSTSYDSIEAYRRSRSCERKRRHQQYLTIQKYGKNNGEDSQVFWDGFQWVKKGHGTIGYDQLMNATRRARRLHVGNLPTHITLCEEDFRLFFWGIMKLNGLCHSDSVCPIVHVWFAKDRGGNYGFVEMASVEEALSAMRLDGTVWHGSTISINRPTDWKKALNDQVIKLMAGTSGLATAESVAAAIHQAVMTGNSSGLASVLIKLPDSDRLIIEDMMKTQNLTFLGIEKETQIGLPVQLVKNKIRTELLSGVPSRIVKIIKPFSKLESEKEFKEVLEDVMQECGKYGGIIAALIISVTSKVPINENISIGDIFLEFASINQADDCILNLSGRLYEGKPVQMIRFSEYYWKQNLKFYAEDMFKRKMNMITKSRNSFTLQNVLSQIKI